tara:strand:+ start:2443 stop:5133 length:2691 start_codon:yes stop_codon:yes gene_type:complete
MKNNFVNIILILFLNIIFMNIAISDDFVFNVSEIKITENGNIYKGINGGSITTDNGIEITSENFKYNKLTSLLEANGNVVLFDKINNITIKSEQIFYLKDKELSYTVGKSEAVSGDGITINSDEFFKYNKLSLILEAKGDVKIVDNIKDIIIDTEHIFYFQNEEKFSTIGKTKVNVEDRYFIESKNIVFFRKDMLLTSKKKTTITDTLDNFYKLNDFNYKINDEILKGNKIELITNYKKEKSDKYFFNTGFFDLKNDNFLAKDIKIDFYNEMFDEENNNPRLKGVSTTGDEFNTFVNKGTFTTCKQNNDKCPPWLIKAEQIKHDKIKKQIEYKNAWLKIYDVPVFYFPKFFHPDPSVVRQSGFLKPKLENSDTLGTSINTPYFYVISDNKDITIKPKIFDNDKYLFQTEYRVKNENSFTIADFSYVKGYQSRTAGDTRDSRTHLFTKNIRKLNFDSFLRSDLEIQFQKASNDTYLKVFDLQSPLLEEEDNSVLETFIKLDLENENYNFTTSIEQYETLSGLNSDRFQYVLPSYNLSTSFLRENFEGNFNFNSYGNNTLKSTNIMSSSITNDLNYLSLSSYLDIGIKNDFGFYTKNLNSVGKNSLKYKANPQYELMGGYMFNSSFPLIKKNTGTISTFEPKFSFKFSPHEMKNHTNSGSRINMSNIYGFNRLGLSDSIEEGESLTIGFDYKKEKIKKEKKRNKKNDKKIENYFEMKFATVLRAKEEKNIPKTSTLNKKLSNIFGQVNYELSEYISLTYDFSIDNDLSTFEYNSLDAEFTYNNFSSTVTFLEENGEIGKTNVISNTFEYSIDESNSLKFATRRNKEINLTEYYDLIYQYKNDCLTAGIEFKKKYYSNADIKPSEEIFFSITILPLGTFSPAALVPKRILNDDFKAIFE